MEKAEIMQSRRQFLKKSLTVAAGLAVTSKMGSLATALAEEPTATATPEPYKWIPSAPPCKLIEEITATDAPEGTRSFKFTTDGRTCSKSVTFDIVGGDYILKNVVYDGGCNGGTQGIGAMAEGRPQRGSGRHFEGHRLRPEEVRLLLRPAAGFRHSAGADDHQGHPLPRLLRHHLCEHEVMR